MDLKEVALAIPKKAFDFSGEASRLEFWLFVLAYLGAILIVGGFSAPALLVIFLVLLVPFLAVCVRRLHDVGLSGWVMLVGVIPFIGQLGLLLILCRSGSNLGGGYYTGLGTVLGNMFRGGIQGARTGQRINSRMSWFYNSIGQATDDSDASRRSPDCHRKLETRVTEYYCNWCRKTWVH